MHYGKRMLRLAAMPILSGCAGALILSAAMPQAAHAQAAPADVTIDVAAGSLEAGLTRFASQSGYQLLFSSALVDSKSTSGVRGTMRIEEALARLLSGTGLTFRLLDGKTIQIESGVAGDSGERVLGAVRVQGAQSPGLPGATPVNGINGSRDVTATEGTGSYTTGALTAGGKSVSSIKETTQAVSVLTNQQIKDQSITTMDQALRYMPGISATQGSGQAIDGAGPTDADSNIRSNYSSRGFAINRIQIDGGAALQLDGNFQPILDMSLYDHIELVRGSDSFTGFGSPGGVINLVRKRPLDHGQLIVELQAGSWNKYRVMLDASGPLGFDGKLRGRLITTYQANHYFYDQAFDKRLILGGVLDFDVTSSTLLTAGVEYTKQDSLPAYSGVPRYMDGRDIGLPRSTCFCFDWNRYSLESVTPYAELEQRIGDKWTIKAKISRPDQKTYEKQGRSSIYSAISPDSALIGVGGDEYRIKSRQTQIEFTLNGSFKVFDNEQKVTIGYSVTKADAPETPLYQSTLNWSNFSGVTLFDSFPAFDLLHFDPKSIPDPGPAIGELQGYIKKNYYSYGNGYIGLDLAPLPFLSRLHVLTSLRFSTVKYQQDIAQYCTTSFAEYYAAHPDALASNCDQASEVGKELSYDKSFYRHSSRWSQDDNQISWPPQVKFRYDATRNLTIFASYNDIFVRSVAIDKSGQLDYNGNPFSPTQGSNLEGGVKWARSDGALNANVSFYRTETYGGTINISRVPGIICPNPASGRTCSLNMPRDASYTNAQGADFELSGEILKGLQISASFNYAKTKRVTDYGKVGLPNSSFTNATAFTRFPEVIYKLWASYNFGAGSGLKGVSLFVGAQGQGSSYSRGSICKVPGPVDPAFNAPTCVNNEYQDYSFTVPARVVLSVGGSYNISDRWQLQANIDNLLDKTYYASSGDIISNWYGAPRNVTLTLRGKF